jgi:diguanylate cyclase (GGDEF)-like protein/PAS domain S-box-containing protein
MNDNTRTVLFVSDDANDTGLIRNLLAELTDGEWHLEWSRRLSDGIHLLGQKPITAVLLDLFLPDSKGLKTFATLLESAPQTPILILADRKNEATALQATKCGAQEYLLKEHLDAYWLPRVLRSAIERKSAEEKIFVENERAQVTLNSIGDAVLSTDIAGNVSYLNLVAEEMTGWSCEQAIGRPVAEIFRIIDGTTRQPALNPMMQAVRENRTVGLKANCILIRRDGIECAIEDSAAPIHERSGKVTGAVIVFHEASIARDVVKKMAHLAHHDFLTSLPNRILLSDRATNAIAMARRRNKQLALLFLDIDDFKNINDTMGHTIGDKVLQSVAQHLTACVRESDTVSRHGGDEFVVLLAEIEHAKDAALIAAKILQALAAPLDIDGTKIQITVSMGVSIYPTEGLDIETLIRCADTAMYLSKAKGRNSYQISIKDNNAQVVEQRYPKKRTVSSN